MKKTILFLTFLLFLIFSAAAIGGGYMTYLQIITSKNSSFDKSSASEVKIETSEASTSIEITTVLPGLIIFVFGAAGLLLLLIKIPVREVMKSQPAERVLPEDRGLGYKGVGPRELRYPTREIHEYNHLMYSRSDVSQPRKYRVSLPVWWLLKLGNRNLAREIA